MSTMHAARPRQRTTRQAQPTSLPLRLVAPVRSRASRAPFVVVVLTVLGAGLVGLILLSTVLQAQAFEIARLSTRADALGVQQQELRREVDRLQAPAALAERAIRLGMVPNANPAFLRPSDGEVIGDPEPAEPRSNVTRVDR
ncbi:hypothetical protein [Aeromicrobium sp. Leaf291]|uniref:hypothetical protein n=1 Tax=Aeromicrobium sp. Leaf291 TaxID=1736325 RepID=UPI0006F584E6|nr:hypothetical protein [Aeromicrobium sp. Leaf291]KQP84987.1 hypothetical protein ASF35_09200 [Aeromicrobium sp. Leaf291]